MTAAASKGCWPKPKVLVCFVPYVVHKAYVDYGRSLTMLCTILSRAEARLGACVTCIALIPLEHHGVPSPHGLPPVHFSAVEAMLLWPLPCFLGREIFSERRNLVHSNATPFLVAKGSRLHFCAPDHHRQCCVPLERLKWLDQHYGLQRSVITLHNSSYTNPTDFGKLGTL